MDKQKSSSKQLPNEVDKMLATAKEMESVLNSKLEKIDKLSTEKSDMAKKEAMKIKADLEEIRRLSLVKTTEGEAALRAKILEVNQRIEMVSRKAAEMQNKIVQIHKELMDEATVHGEKVKKAILAIEQLSDEEKKRMMDGVDSSVNQASARFAEMSAALVKMNTEIGKAKEMKPDPSMSQEDLMRKIQSKLEQFISGKSEEDLTGPNTFKAEPRKKDKE